MLLRESEEGTALVIHSEAVSNAHIVSEFLEMQSHALLHNLECFVLIESLFYQVHLLLYEPDGGIPLDVVASFLLLRAVRVELELRVASE